MQHLSLSHPMRVGYVGLRVSPRTVGFSPRDDNLLPQRVAAFGPPAARRLSASGVGFPARRLVLLPGTGTSVPKGQRLPGAPDHQRRHPHPAGMLSAAMPAPEGARVTLNPHPEARGVGKIMAPLIGIMIKRLNQRHLRRTPASGRRA